MERKATSLKDTLRTESTRRNKFLNKKSIAQSSVGDMCSLACIQLFIEPWVDPRIRFLVVALGGIKES